MRALLTVILMMLASNAQAKTLLIDCQRYESKCTAAKCYDIAQGLRDLTEESKKEVLTLQKMDLVHYTIEDTYAKVSVDNDTIKYTPEFKYVTKDEIFVTLENKTDSGAVKERIIIEKQNGFYTKYLLHTDGSLKDIPVGEPYNAYFGWCENKTPKKSALSPVPNAPVQPIIADTP